MLFFNRHLQWKFRPFPRIYTGLTAFHKPPPQLESTESKNNSSKSKALEKAFAIGTLWMHSWKQTKIIEYAEKQTCIIRLFFLWKPNTCTYQWDCGWITSKEITFRLSSVLVKAFVAYSLRMAWVSVLTVLFIIWNITRPYCHQKLPWGNKIYIFPNISSDFWRKYTSGHGWGIFLFWTYIKEHFCLMGHGDFQV